MLYEETHFTDEETGKQGFFVLFCIWSLVSDMADNGQSCR